MIMYNVWMNSICFTAPFDTISCMFSPQRPHHSAPVLPCLADDLGQNAKTHSEICVEPTNPAVIVIYSLFVSIRDYYIHVVRWPGSTSWKGTGAKGRGSEENFPSTETIINNTTPLKSIILCMQLKAQGFYIKPRCEYQTQLLSSRAEQSLTEVVASAYLK